jgi:peroxiredoxin
MNDQPPTSLSRRTLLRSFGALGVIGLLAGCSTDTPVKLTHVTVQTIDGQPIDLAKIMGKPTVITFWATTCPGCVEEIPRMEALQKKFGPKGVQVIGMAMSYDSLSQLQAMVKEKGITYTVWQDKTGAAAAAFGPVRLTPTFFVLDGAGVIRYQKIGPFDAERVDQLLTQLSANT